MQLNGSSFKQTNHYKTYFAQFYPQFTVYCRPDPTSGVALQRSEFLRLLLDATVHVYH